MRKISKLPSGREGMFEYNDKKYIPTVNYDHDIDTRNCIDLETGEIYQFVSCIEVERVNHVIYYLD